MGCAVDDAGTDVAPVDPCWEVGEVLVGVGWGEAAVGKCLDGVEMSHWIDDWRRLWHMMELGWINDEEESELAVVDDQDVIGRGACDHDVGTVPMLIP